MTKETLSDKIYAAGLLLRVRHAKEKIQNVERRLRAPIESELKIAEKHDSNIARTVKLLLNQILKNQNKIFLEEIGEELLK